MTLVEAIQNLAESAIKNTKVFNPESLKDDLALKVGWNALSTSYSNFETVKFVEYSNKKIGFKPTPISFGFPMLFATILLIAIGTGVLTYGEQYGAIAYGIGGFVLIDIVIATYFIVRFSSRPITFDKQIGIYYKGRKFDQAGDFLENKNQCKLLDIYAIQLIKKVSRSRDSSSMNSTTNISYELNLVLKNTFRINVLTSNKLYNVRKYGDSIGKFLNVPVWDGATIARH